MENDNHGFSGNVRIFSTSNRNRSKCSYAVNFHHFTLLDLLIVIAIITILAGMLLPALNKAREKARSITCSNNQKQINMAIIAYQQDSDDYFPPYKTIDTTQRYYWSGHLAAGGYTGGMQKNFKIFLCPGKMNLKTAEILETTNPYNREVLNQIDYGVNYRHFYSNRYASGTAADGGTPYGPQAKAIHVRNPSIKISFADVYLATAAEIGSATLEWENKSNGGLLSTRHGGSVNVGWVDGHVSNVKTQTQWHETAGGGCYPKHSAFDPYIQFPFNGVKSWERK